MTCRSAASGAERNDATLKVAIINSSAFEPSILKRECKGSRLTRECSTTLRSTMGDNQASVISFSAKPGEMIRLSETPKITKEISQTLTRSDGKLGDNQPTVIAFTQNTREEVRSLGNAAGALSAANGTHQTTYISSTQKNNSIDNNMKAEVRRLTPTEVQRLQGFDEGHLNVNNQGDSAIYSETGNSWAVPNARAVIKGIHKVDTKLYGGKHRPFKYGTISSGVESHTQASAGFGDKAMFFSEIAPAPSAVLAAHYPNVPNLGDMTLVDYDAEKKCIHNHPYEWYREPDEKELGFKPFKTEAPVEIPCEYGEIDLVSGGTPCQSVSCAGKRHGMAENSNTRSSLAFQLPRIGAAVGAEFILWENVCFGSDTLITTSQGHKRIADVKVGDEVRSHDGKFHKVINVMETPSCETIKIQAMGAEEISVTTNHPFFARKKYPNKENPYQRKMGAPKWVAAGELSMDHYLGYKVDGEGTESIGISNAYAVGRWLADGSVAVNTRNTGKRGGQFHRIFISCGWKKHDALKRELTRLPYAIKESKIKDYAINFTFVSDAFYELIKDCRKGARNKKVPEYIHHLIPAEQKEFLRGYFDGDGHLHKQREMTYSSSSHDLALGIARVIRNVYHRGVSIRHIKGLGHVTIGGRTVNAHDSWSCSFANSAVPPEGKTHLISFYENGYVWCPIRSITNGDVRTVYNLTVDETHTYEANDIVVHNCGAFSSNGGRDLAWLLHRMTEYGYTALAWRCMDAQYIRTDKHPRAVPQRRRRIWVVGYRGSDWRIPCEALFEPMKALGDEPPRRTVGVGYISKTPINTASEPQKTELEEFESFIANAKTRIIDTLIDKGVCEPPEMRMKELKDQTNATNASCTLDLFGGDLFGTPEEKHQGRGLKAKDLDLNFPNNADIRSISQVELFQWAKTVCKEICYFGELFKNHEGNPCVEDLQPNMLENIGNAGFLCNGLVCTMKMPEWNAGVTEEELSTMPKELAELYDGDVCGLSDVLEDNPDPKYKLSWRACYGILRRAVNRGKKLPIELGYALVERIIEQASFVKWIAINGKDTTKKESDVSERQIAKTCFDDYIRPELGWDGVAELEPKKNCDEPSEDGDSDGESGIDGEDGESEEE